MELAGGAYFFAYFGFMVMVIAGWLLMPRTSFVVTIALFVHEGSWINLYNGKGVDLPISVIAIIALVVFGLILDIFVLQNFFRRLIKI